MSLMTNVSSIVSLSCPICSEVFSSSAGALFALHVSDCSCLSPRPSSFSSSSSSCPRCYHVYSTDLLPHEISFHERECGRVNSLFHVETNDKIDVNCPVSDHKTKRQRHDNPRIVGTTPHRRVSLFPSTCFLCGNTGRGLLHCTGTCARSVHQHCIGQLQAAIVGDPLSILEKKQAADHWQCAQCLRGIHACQRCGFLGQEGNGMENCAVLNCGYYYHQHCQSSERSEQEECEFICARHTCRTCHTQETDMKRCKSCFVCLHMTHLRCPRGSGAAMPTTSSGLEEPINFFQCPRHDEETTVTRTWNSDANNSLRRRFAIGDVVLVLELNNAFLPLSVKTAAPDAANHWGVVVSVEEMDPRECGNQLLKVRMFADENVLAVPNQYAMRITAASDFSRPVDLIRHCVQRHAMVELQLRQMEGKIDDAEAKRILLVSNTAFTARLKKLGVTAAQAMSDAEEGLARWRQFHDLAEPRQYDGLGEAAPIYLYIDTRGSRPGQQNSGSTNTANVVADAVKDVEGDVSMTDTDTNNGGAAIHGSTFGSPHSKRPESAGKSPHEAEIEQSAKTEAILVDTRLICCSRLKQSQASTENTMLTDTQDTQPENDSLSWSRGSFDVARSQSISSTPACMNTPSSDVVGSDANRNQLTSDVTKSADTDSAKRQKLSTESRVHFNTAVCTPTKTIHKFFPGSTLSSASAPATLHISPMASSARTLFSQKRKELTRKQKLLAEMPPLVMKELEREALRYLEEADELKLKLARIPADVDAFPWAARATRFRPAFYRPTVMLGHGGLRRPGLDAVSRLLVSQDKRSIKCFVQTLETNAEVSRCTHLRKTTTAASPGFMLLDLLSLRSFRDLESVVRRRVVEALGKRSRYMREYFGMDAHQVRRWLEQQRCKKTCDQPPITLSYCAADGVRRHLYLHEVSPKPSPKDMQAWLCFCANVCHVSVAIMIQSVARSTLTPITTALQPVSATQ